MQMDGDMLTVSAWAWVCVQTERVKEAYSLSHTQIYICQQLCVHWYMYVRKWCTSICCVFVCECVSQNPGRGLQRFCLSATVSGYHSGWQCGRTWGSLVDTEGVREGAEWRRVQERKGREGQWLCVSRAVHLNIRLENITHSSALSSQSRNQPTAETPPLSFPPPPSLTLHPSYSPSSLCLSLTLSVPPHISLAVASLKHGVLHIFSPPSPNRSLHLSSRANCSHFLPLCSLH